VEVGGEAAEVLRRAAEGPTKVILQRSAAQPTDDQGFWAAIRNRTEAISFRRYQEFIDRVFCGGQGGDAFQPFNDLMASSSKALNRLKERSADNACCPTIHGPYAYQVLKLATQVFLILEAGVVMVRGNTVTLLDPSLFNERLSEEASRFGEPVTIEDIEQRLTAYFSISTGPTRQIPYLRHIVETLVKNDGSDQKEVLPYCEGILLGRLNCPSMLELIWSYWHEEGMLVQTMNAIALRFQNRRRGERDPLANLEINPLRPLNNLLWGFIQDEHNRLSVPRRAYEYDHHYGLTLVGKAVPRLESADSRSKFIESFHNLLHRVSVFYREDNDTTVHADAFPLLNALKEVHLLLTEGQHNQFGDLPWTARVEMLIMQWLLARSEIRDFLRGRDMVRYYEDWMGAVDAMKRAQGWTDTTVTHFHELAFTGERILLSIRYGDWVDINNIEDQAKNWARNFKPEIQRYIHAYQTVTGVDLSAEVTDTREAAERYLQPSALLQRRLEARPAQGMLPPAAPIETRRLAAKVRGNGELPMRMRNRLLRYREDE
jgi:hypothetical protein